MPYEYNPAGDDFYLKEGNATTPKTMEDCYNGDKAGILTNHSRTGIAGTDASSVAPTYAIRPTDYRVLGGPANDLWLLISAWTNMTSATIRIIGTDLEGVSQQEDVAISGNGTYYTTKRYKTVTGTQVVAFSGTGSFDYKLEQGQFGSISKTGTKSYVVHSNFWLWDYGGSAGLALEDVSVVFEKEFNTYYYSGCYLRLGKILNGRGIAGAKVVVSGNQEYKYGTMEIYGSVCNLAPRSGNAKNTVIDSVISNFGLATIGDIMKRITVYGVFNYELEPTTEPEDIFQHNATYGTFYGNNNGRIKNVTFRNNATSDIYNYYDRTTYMRDCDWARTVTGNGIVYDEYTLNLKVTNKNGVGVPSVSVKAYKNGDYTGLEPNVGATPILDTTTDGNGKIPEKGLVQWKWVNGAVTDYNPFLWVLSHPDYPTKKFIMTMPRTKLKDGDWTYAYAEETTGTHAEIIREIKTVQTLQFAFG